MNRTYFIRLTKNSSVDFGTGHYCIDPLGGGGGGGSEDFVCVAI